MTALDMGITGFKTPAESPDMNLIEKVWKEIKDEVRMEGPVTQDALADSILKAWEKVSVETCNKYINHVRSTVFEKVVSEKGKASGY